MAVCDCEIATGNGDLGELRNQTNNFKRVPILVRTSWKAQHQCDSTTAWPKIL